MKIDTQSCYSMFEQQRSFHHTFQVGGFFFYKFGLQWIAAIAYIKPLKCFAVSFKTSSEYVHALNTSLSFSPWWTETKQKNCQSCSVVSSTSFAPLCTRSDIKPHQHTETFTTDSLQLTEQSWLDINMQAWHLLSLISTPHCNDLICPGTDFNLVFILFWVTSLQDGSGVNWITIVVCTHFIMFPKLLFSGDPFF